MSRYVLHGVDGRARSLSSGRFRLVKGGVVGLFGAPVPEVAARSLATRPGRRRTSIRYLHRDGKLSVAINAGQPREDLLSAEKDWWAAWSTVTPATLEVQTKGKPSRFLELYLQDDEGLAHELDPDALGVYVATVNVTADEPLWRSPSRSIVFDTNEPDADFFGRDEVHQQDGGPDYWLSASNLPRVRRIDNKGDLPAPVVWKLTGPFEEFDTTVDGRAIGGRFAVPAAHVLTIDAARKTARLWNGVEEVSVWRQLSSWDFGFLQPGKAAEVSVRLEGAGTAVLEYVPQHLRARA